MKTLLQLVLSIVAVAQEATAQDVECVRERAAMVETIRAYARSDASVFGQQGLSERVLEAMAQTKRHLFIPKRSCSIAYADRPFPTPCVYRKPKLGRSGGEVRRGWATI
jgi:protein-L-isoaspartate(D-aspartate) O-methyltransferase